MTRFVLLLFAAALLAGATLGAPLRAEQAVVAILDTQQLSVSSGPGSEFATVDVFYAGTFVAVREIRGDWLRVEADRFGTPAWGWAWKGAILPLRDPVEWLEVADPQDMTLNLRAGPGTGHEIIYKMPNGSRAMVLGTESNWHYVRHDSNMHGWAWSAALKHPAPKTPPAMPLPAGRRQ